MATRARWAAFTVLLVMLTSCAWCQSADVVLVRAAGTSSTEQQETVELSTAVFMRRVNLKVVSAGESNSGAVLRALRQNTTLGVAIQADALASISQDELLGALRDGVPVLILGVTPETQPTLLSTWSGGAAVGVQRLESTARPHYVVGRVVGITQQLTDLEIPFPGHATFYFELAENTKAQEIMAVRNDHQVVPVFIEADLRQRKVFLLSKTHPVGDSGVEAGTESIETAFAAVAHVMMFVKYCAGEHGWHALHHYANLTIDDPWLHEPYGNLSYKGLLKEMEKHDFHTTIAFIPWNYDRSEAETISLFRNHPDRFSICIHGDNHDHKEFEGLESKPLDIQVAALKQSLARMDKFQRLTGIPYDNVFVFPHSIGTSAILEELKSYNFLATINSSNVPMDRVMPATPLFALRPVTLSFADFPSISRYSAATASPNGMLRVNEFLDNPVFFYTHQEFFGGGIDAFDGMADDVNKAEPHTQWRSVGDIVKHLYLVKQRDESKYDVLTFSNSFDLENTSARSSVFEVEKQESDSRAIASVRVDGDDYPFQLRGEYLDLSITIPAEGVRSVVIHYKNDLNLASISTSKSSLPDYVLRTVSDFRDITLSKYYLGRAFTDYYYKNIYGKRSPTLLLIVSGGILVLFTAGGSWGLWLIMNRKNPVAVNPEALRNDKIARARGVGSTPS